MLHIVGLVLMCAGSSSRFNPYGEKFLQSINLSERTCMMELIFRRLSRFSGQKKTLQIIISCNQENMDLIQDYLKSKSYFGF